MCGVCGRRTASPPGCARVAGECAARALGRPHRRPAPGARAPPRRLLTAEECREAQGVSGRAGHRGDGAHVRSAGRLAVGVPRCPVAPAARAPPARSLCSGGSADALRAGSFGSCPTVGRSRRGVPRGPQRAVQAARVTSSERFTVEGTSEQHRGRFFSETSVLGGGGDAAFCLLSVRGEALGAC